MGDFHSSFLLGLPEQHDDRVDVKAPLAGAGAAVGHHELP